MDKIEAAAPKPSYQNASTPAEALELLRSEPDHSTLISTLKFLASCQNFSIHSPSPLASQLVNVLVSDIVPNYWSVLQTGKTSKKAKQASPGASKISELQLLLSCLQSVSGLNAVLLSLKRLIQQSKESRISVGGPNFVELLLIYLYLLQAILEGPQTVEAIWSIVFGSSGSVSKQKTVWNEFLSLVGGGKILGIVAEVLKVVFR